jgi:hypothetical protein
MITAEMKMTKERAEELLIPLRNGMASGIKSGMDHTSDRSPRIRDRT